MGNLGLSPCISSRYHRVIFLEITSVVIWTLKYHNLYTSSQSNNWYLMPESSWDWGAMCQSIVLSQCWWTSIQGISTLILGSPSAKVYLSAKFCLLVVKACMLYNLWVFLFSLFLLLWFCLLLLSMCNYIIKQQQQHEIIRRTRTTTKT